MAEFLPLCDVLFNVISLAGYFCDVVFDVVMSYALLERGYKRTFAAAITLIVSSLVITQVLSLRWYLHVWSNNSEGRKGRPPWAPVLLHCLQLGVLWRYARLFVPVDLRHVKHQVRDLCMLRLVHAFCEAAPMLLLQLRILLTVEEDQPDPPRTAANKAFEQLNVISAALSLFSVCWALASFSKNVRLHNVHRLVLTWLGVIFQFFWRLGTVSSRVWALTLYAQVYHYWVALVIGLHWVSMFLWLISPKSVFHGERLSRPRKLYLSALVAAVHIFAYINLHEHGHRRKMAMFYGVMCVENLVLCGAWWGATGLPRPAAAVPLLAAAGLAFMLLYYRYFHVRRLGYLLGGAAAGGAGGRVAELKGGALTAAAANNAIPGVFNCRFTNPVNGANGRKKKKPTSFVPPPAAPATPSTPAGLTPSNPALTPAPALAPALAAPAPAAPHNAFWRRPLPNSHHHHGGSSENEGSSVGSRVNIQQKLQEKKQKQLAELRVIEEEIKQGKLAKTTPVAAEEIYSSLQRQPIPRAKTHGDSSWPTIELSHQYQNYPILPHTCNVYPTYTEIKPNFDFQNNSTDINGMRRQNRNTFGDNTRTMYENPAVEVTRPLRSNYLAIGDNRNYNCASPRNVINSSPRCFNQDMQTSTNYEIPNTSLDKPRIPFTDNRQIEYTYNENNQNLLYSNKFDKDTFPNGQSAERSNFENVSKFDVKRFPSKKLEQIRRMQRCNTPEILLAPHYLDAACMSPAGTQLCCDWPPPYNIKVGSSGSESPPRDSSPPPRPHSDIDSQVSLPRSYTLPREFRYWRRRPRPAHTANSSDGDVDSGDESEPRSASPPSRASPHSAASPHSPHSPHSHHSPHSPGSPAHSDRRRHRRRRHKPQTEL